MSAWAVSVEPPTSVSLTVTSGCLSVYSFTPAFWLMPVNDQNSKVFESVPDESDPESEPLEHPAMSSARAAAAAAERTWRFTGPLPLE